MIITSHSSDLNSLLSYCQLKSWTFVSDIWIRIQATLGRSVTLGKYPFFCVLLCSVKQKLIIVFRIHCEKTHQILTKQLTQSEYSKK